MICRKDFASVKTDIGDIVGKKVLIKGSLGRCKTFEKEATIQKAYTNIFTVKYDDTDRSATYSYTDLLTRTVELDVFDGENFNPLLPPIVDAKV